MGRLLGAALPGNDVAASVLSARLSGAFGAATGPAELRIAVDRESSRQMSWQACWKRTRERDALQIMHNQRGAARRRPSLGVDVPLQTWPSRLCWAIVVLHDSHT